jgi:hypothetical protein
MGEEIEKNDHGLTQPQSKEVRAQAGLTVAVGNRHWQGGRINQQRASGGRKESGEGGPAHPSPAAQPPRTQDPGPWTRAMLVALQM